MIGHPARAAALAVAAAVTTGCSVGLGDLPLPAPGSSGDSYTVQASFSNALNLPAKAKVRLSGADIGEVADMAVRDYTAVVALRIRSDVRVPVGSTAELRTATPLGDVFVSLKPPDDATPNSPSLADGDTIELDRTSAATTIEELLTTASILVNGGVLRNLTTLVNGLGRAVGDRGDRMAALLAQSNGVVQKLSARSADIRTTLNEVNQLTQQIGAQQGTIDDVLAGAGPALDTLRANSTQALSLIHEAAGITKQIATFPGIDASKTAGLVADINRIADQMNAAATTPGASLAAVNAILAPVMKRTNSTGGNADATWMDLTIGAVPDVNHGVAPETRLPDVGDVANVIGTLAFALTKLQEKVIGPGR
ncbi:MlaD family protein [Skermania piniformis]|uniref:MCE family protein n=1 Tax=Skermania pinensis TaxID=39122 RepID=A0ABX8SC54_9ACTN|nr:MlaD family protein [Skermania piniformis]QXQ15373.1 MCE family protein [Skermania piniformis]